MLLAGGFIQPLFGCVFSPCSDEAAGQPHFNAIRREEVGGGPKLGAAILIFRCLRMPRITAMPWMLSSYVMLANCLGLVLLIHFSKLCFSIRGMFPYFNLWKRGCRVLVYSSIFKIIILKGCWTCEQER